MVADFTSKEPSLFSFKRRGNEGPAQAEELAPFQLLLFVQEIVAVDVFHQVIAYLVLRGELQAVFAHEHVLGQPFGGILDRGFAIVGT